MLQSLDGPSDFSPRLGGNGAPVSGPPGASMDAQSMPSPTHDDAVDTHDLKAPFDPELVPHFEHLASDVLHAVRRFSIPMLVTDRVRLVVQGVRDAIAMGQAVVITADRGAGKSRAVKYVMRVIEAGERAALEAAPDNYQLMRVVYVPRLTGRTVRENAVTLLKELTPGNVRDRTFGLKNSEDDMVKKLCAALSMKRVGLLIIDEMELAPDEAIELLRRVLASSNDGDTESSYTTQESAVGALGAAAGVDAGAVDHDERVGGVAMALLGTPEVADRLQASPDSNGRFAQFISFGYLAPSEVAPVYEAIFPGFAAGIEAIGRARWEHMVREEIVRGRRIAMRQLVNHCRLYFATLYEASRAPGSAGLILHREETPLDPPRFLFTFNSLDAATVRQVSASTRPGRGRGTGSGRRSA